MKLSAAQKKVIERLQKGGQHFVTHDKVKLKTYKALEKLGLIYPIIYTEMTCLTEKGKQLNINDL